MINKFKSEKEKEITVLTLEEFKKFKEDVKEVKYYTKNLRLKRYLYLLGFEYEEIQVIVDEDTSLNYFVFDYSSDLKECLNFYSLRRQKNMSSNYKEDINLKEEVKKAEDDVIDKWLNYFNCQNNK